MEHGADINYKSNSGYTSLVFICEKKKKYHLLNI